MMMAWAVGGGDQILPEEAGIPFVNNDSDVTAVKYIRVQMCVMCLVFIRFQSTQYICIHIGTMTTQIYYQILLIIVE